MSYEIKRGEIWWADISGGVGSEQGGLRPCLIIQNDVGNQHSPTTIICPITKKGKKFNVTHVPIQGLPQPSNVLCEQVKTIDKSRLKEYVLTLDDERMEIVSRTLKLALGML